MIRQQKEKNMGVAKFIAKDAYSADALKNELDSLLGKMDGVLDWAINLDDDEVAVEYDHELINDEMIEEALSGVGLKLKHISDEPDMPEREAMETLDQEEAQAETYPHE